MKHINKSDTNDKVVHGLLRLSIKLDRISDMLLEQDRQDWILESVDEALDDTLELFLLARRSKAT
jgi:hypothetical protein